MCEQNGILLITLTPEDDLSEISEIIKKSSHHKKAILQIADFNREIDFDRVWQHRNKIASLRQFVGLKNGKLISKKYQGQKTHLIWECEKGHRCTAAPMNILGGHWCPKCAGRPQLTITDMRKVAEEFDGNCLSKEYVNATSALNWRCKNGHEWQASYAHIRAGYCVSSAPGIPIQRT